MLLTVMKQHQRILDIQLCACALLLRTLGQGGFPGPPHPPWARVGSLPPSPGLALASGPFGRSASQPHPRMTARCGQETGAAPGACL